MFFVPVIGVRLFPVPILALGDLAGFLLEHADSFLFHGDRDPQLFLLASFVVPSWF